MYQGPSEPLPQAIKCLQKRKCSESRYTETKFRGMTPRGDSWRSGSPKEASFRFILPGHQRHVLRKYLRFWLTPSIYKALPCSTSVCCERMHQLQSRKSIYALFRTNRPISYHVFYNYRFKPHEWKFDHYHQWPSDRGAYSGHVWLNNVCRAGREPASFQGQSRC